MFVRDNLFRGGFRRGRQNHWASRRFGKVIAVAAVLVGLSTVATTVSARAADQPKGLTVSPATQSIDLKNGQQYTGQMNVTNNTDADMKLKFSVGSYSIVDNNYSAPNYDSPSKYSVIKDWTKLDKSETTLKPGEETVLNYTINTPDNPPAGMQYATIFAETVPTKTVTSGITATSRVGMVLSAKMVDGKTLDKATIQNEKIGGYQQSNPMTASFDIKNEGNVGASVSYSMKVTSAFGGKELYSAKEQSSSIYPETTRTFKVEWSGMGIGFYNVALDINVNGRSHTVKGMVCSIPLWIIILVGIIILGIAGFVIHTIMKHRGRKGSPQRAKWEADRKAKKEARAKRRADAIAKAKVPEQPTYTVPKTTFTTSRRASRKSKK